MDEIEAIDAVGIEETWKPDELRTKLAQVEAGVAWMAETIDELTGCIEKLSADFAAYVAEHPPTDPTDLPPLRPAA